MSPTKVHKIAAFMRKVGKASEGLFIPTFITGPIKAAYKNGDMDELKRLTMELDEAIMLANSLP